MAGIGSKSGLFGLCVGDALGVPVESFSRERLKRHPIESMIGYRVHNQPPGTWSDDSSLTFCLAESLCDSLDPHNIACRFVNWFDHGYWTPHAEVFDCGFTTAESIDRFKSGIPALEAGGTDERDNGNGSLMRILPMAYYSQDYETTAKFKAIEQVSRITHAHPRAIIACSIYVETAIHMLKGFDRDRAYEMMKLVIKSVYSDLYPTDLEYFKRLIESDIRGLTESQINTSGYVVDTLEAALWCLLTGDSYVTTVLTAVNLGGDTDTTAAVAGGLAGICYGYKSIPTEWVDMIVRAGDITDLANRFDRRITAA